jgi:hypothetical protein
MAQDFLDLWPHSLEVARAAHITELLAQLQSSVAMIVPSEKLAHFKKDDPRWLMLEHEVIAARKRHEARSGNARRQPTTFLERDDIVDPSPGLPMTGNPARASARWLPQMR